MKRLAYLLIAPAFLFSCCGGEDSDNETGADSTLQITEAIDSLVEEVPAPPKSPRLQSSGVANGVQVDIDYGSPFVKERKIWGELVPFDKIWRAGANDATAVTFGSDVIINGKPVMAGTYALFMIPKEGETWTVILNEEWSKEIHGVWGAYDHKPEKDVLRFEVKPVYSDDVLESLTYTVTDKGIMFAWADASFEFEITAKK